MADVNQEIFEANDKVVSVYFAAPSYFDFSTDDSRTTDGPGG